MADTYFHISGVPALSADRIVEVTKNLLRNVKDRAGAAEALVVVDTDTSAVTASARAALKASITRAVIVGGAAGNLTVTGITTAQTLAAVVGIKDADQTNHDFTAEFTITATNTINNTGGTATTGYHLVVVYYT